MKPLALILTTSLTFAASAYLVPAKAEEDSAAATAIPAELNELLDSYTTASKENVLEPFDAQIAELNENYSGALDRAFASAQADGNLALVVALTAEKEALAKNKQASSTDTKDEAQSLKSLRQKYHSAVAQFDAEKNQKLRAIQLKLSKSIDALVQDLTREGKIKEALATKAKGDEFTKQIAQIGDGEEVIASSPTEPAEPTEPAKTEDNPATDNIDRYFIGETWMSTARAFYAFERDGEGSRTHAGIETEFTWKKRPDGLVEVLGKMGPTSPPRKWFFKFDNRKTAMFGNTATAIEFPMTAQ